jgi:hypothetical protein
MAWRQRAILCWHTGDGAGYRRVCTEMAARFGRSSGWVDPLYVALACGQAPGGVDDPARLVSLAQGVTAVAPDNFWTWRARATACYRAGRHEEAIRYMQKGLAADGVGQYRPQGWMVLALANQRLGKTAEARRWLEQVEKWLANQRRDGRAADACPADWTWWDWLELLALRREAG